jgi:hypothetical protein
MILSPGKRAPFNEPATCPLHVGRGDPGHFVSPEPGNRLSGTGKSGRKMIADRLYVGFAKMPDNQRSVVVEAANQG